MDHDMGQSWVLKGNTGTYTVRVFDVDGNVYKGKSFTFAIPPECANTCGGNPVYKATMISS
jgi:hypothetical protein